jgi:hypothetical protein
MDYHGFPYQFPYGIVEIPLVCGVSALYLDQIPSRGALRVGNKDQIGGSYGKRGYPAYILLGFGILPMEHVVLVALGLEIQDPGWIPYAQGLQSTGKLLCPGPDRLSGVHPDLTGT